MTEYTEGTGLQVPNGETEPDPQGQEEEQEQEEREEPQRNGVVELLINVIAMAESGAATADTDRRLEWTIAVRDLYRHLSETVVPLIGPMDEVRAAVEQYRQLDVRATQLNSEITTREFHGDDPTG